MRMPFRLRSKDAPTRPEVQGGPIAPSPAAASLTRSTGPRLLLDVPSSKPALGFPRIAEALSELIVETTPQFAIGIFGSWGSGKTTLMRQIESSLDEEGVVCVRFSAWRYEREEHLIIPMLDAVREGLFEWSQRHEGEEVARSTARTIGRVMRSIAAGLTLKVGFAGAIEASFEANRALEEHERGEESDDEARVPRSFYHASFRALERAFAEFVESGRSADPSSQRQRRIVVFVDDLDRCLPENALQVVEAMKLFFDFEGFVFVVGLDQVVVEHLIDVKYRSAGVNPSDTSSLISGQMSGEEYIKKVFQLPYRLAPVSPEQLDEFLTSAYDEAGISEKQRLDLEVVQRHLRYVVGRDINPREIKRYINLYTLNARINAERDPDIVLVLQTTQFRREWRPVREAILEFREEYIAYLRRNAVAYSGDGEVTVDDDLGEVPGDFLEYIRDGQPGHSLIATGGLDLGPYVWLGEAVHSTRGPTLLEALQTLGRVRAALRAAQSEPEKLKAAVLDPLALAIEQIRGAGAGSTADAVVSRAQTLHRQTERAIAAVLNDSDPAVREAAMTPLLDGARLLSKQLRNLYRSGDAAPEGSAYRRRPEQYSADREDLFNAGVTQEEAGELRAAEASFRAADEQGHGPAALRLGMLLLGRDERDAAEAAFHRAAERGEAKGASQLGLLLLRRGELAAAEEPLRSAASSDARAALQLAFLLERRGEREGAVEAFTRAHELGEPEAGFHLAFLLDHAPEVQPLPASSASKRTRGKLDLADLQGNLLAGYGLPYAAYLFVEIEDGRAGRRLLRALLPTVTSAAPWRDARPLATTNVAVTFKALAGLGMPGHSLAGFPREFQEGMQARAHLLDRGRGSGKRNFEFTMNDRDPYLLVMLHAQSRTALDSAARPLLDRIERTPGLTLRYREDADALASREHFGYRDGFAQPVIEGSGNVGEGVKPTKPGEFLLGYEDEEGDTANPDSPYTRNGTFMVFRKLRQDVVAFRRIVSDASERVGESAAAAMIVGRRQDGTPLLRSHEAAPPTSIRDLNDFEYSSDPDGLRCPLGAHIRRANPRDEAPNRRHQLIRRSMPYGPPLPPGAADDGADRGLLFICFNASIARQFEYVQTQRLQSDAGLSTAQGPDFLTGAEPQAELALNREDATVLRRDTALVTALGGAYLFVPGLRGLELLATENGARGD